MTAAVVVLLVCSLSDAKSQNWIEVRSAHFVVVSNAGEKQARKTALQFEQIRAFFRQSLTVAGQHPSPFVIVLAAKDESTMRELLPEYWAKGHAHVSGMFATRLNQYFASVQLDAPGSDPFETFYHEYYHSITVPYFPDLPLWLSEGLAEFYGHTDIEEKYVGTGRIDDNLLRELRESSLIPLNVLLKVDQSSPYYNQANETSIFYAESWALTHYLMIGDREAHKALLMAYLEALSQGKTEEEAATTAFGDLKKLQSGLLVYLRQATFLYRKLPPAKLTDDELKVRTISEAEAEAYRGGFAAARGQTQQAAEALTKALQLDPNTSLAHEYLAMAQFLDGQSEKALQSASQAVTLDPNNSSARYLRACFATNGSAIMSTDAPVEEDLRQAIVLSPDFSPPYALLGLYLAVRTAHLDEALALAEKAVSFEPGSSTYQLDLAQVLARMNKYPEAGAAAARASAWARDPQEKGNADAFRSYLEQARRFQSLTQSESSDGAPAGAAPSTVTPHLLTLNAGSAHPPLTALHLAMNVKVLGGAAGASLKSYVTDVLGSLRDRLLSPVAQSAIKQTRNLALEFSISKDGAVSNVKVASSSGDASLDQSAWQAITAASPFKALPSELAGKPLALHMDLTYSQESADLH